MSGEKLPDIKQKIADEIKAADSLHDNGEYQVALEQYLQAASLVASRDWYIPLRQKIHSLLAFDIDNDECVEVVFGSEDGKVTAFKSKATNPNQPDTKEFFWEFPTSNWVTGIEPLPIKDIEGKTAFRLVIASDKIYILNSDGTKHKDCPTESRVSSLKVFRDGDGEFNIVAGLASGKIVFFDDELNQRDVQFPKKGLKGIGSVSDLAVGKFLGNGEFQIAAVSEDRNIYILDCNANLQDTIQTNHWISNMDSLPISEIKSRLYIGEFRSTVFNYSPEMRNRQPIKLEISGILDIKVMPLFDDNNEPLLIVGSTDRQFCIFTLNGQLLWTFEAGLGQRAISLHKTSAGEIKLFIGTESGEIFAYTLSLTENLLAKIRNAYETLKSNLAIDDLMDIKLSSKQLNLLRTFLVASEYNPIKAFASLESARLSESKRETQKSIFSLMEIWWNECEYIDSFSTQGIVYDVKFECKNTDQQNKLIYCGAADGAYCLSPTLDKIWAFHSSLGKKGEMRGIFVDNTNQFVVVASGDGSLYCLDTNGNPLWNFQHTDEIMYVCADVTTSNEIIIFAGTDDHTLLVIDKNGVLLWKYDKIKSRIRAITTCTLDSTLYTIVGSDDCNIYVINCDSKETRFFSTPHYALVVKVYDINGDGIPEILVGSEDGCLNVYDFDGNFLWRFVTDSWVAALDIYKNTQTGFIEIAIGSQDNHMYGLDCFGALLWQFEAALRVRTISANSETAQIAFGSYDNKVHLIERVVRSQIVDSLKDVYDKQSNQLKSSFGLRYKESKHRYERAFYYLFINELDELCDATGDPSEIVLASIAFNLLRNFSQSPKAQAAIERILKDVARETRALIFREISSLYRKDAKGRTIAYDLMCKAIVEADSAKLKIDAFRHWLTMCPTTHDVFLMTEELIDIDDEYINDEVYHACQIALQLPHSIDDLVTRRSANKILKVMEARYPYMADRLRKEFP